MTRPARTQRLFGIPAFDAFSPAYYALLLVILFVPLKAILVSQGMSSFRFTDYRHGLLAVSLSTAYVSAAIAAFLVLSRIHVRPLYRMAMSILPRKLDGDLSRPYRYTILAMFLVFAVYGLYEAVLRSVGLSLLTLEVERLVDVKIAFGRNPIAYLLLKQFADMLLLVGIFVLARAVFQQGHSRLSLLLLVAAGVHLSTATGSRGVLLWMVITPLLISYNCYRRRIRLAILIPLFASVVMLAGVLEVVRQAKDLGTVRIGALVRNIDVNTAILLALERRTDSYFPNLMIFLDNERMFPRRWGTDYVSIVTQHIPRSVYPEKPVSFIREYNERLQIQASGGTGLAPIGEAWVNFGAVGVVLMAVFAGAVVAVSHRFYLYSRDEASVLGLIVVVSLLYVVVGKVVISPGLTHNAPELTLRVVQVVVAAWVVYTILRFRLPAAHSQSQHYPMSPPLHDKD